MAGDNVTNASSSTGILQTLAKCLVAFYSVAYIVASICFGAFKLQTFDGKMPFNFVTWIDLTRCCTSYSKVELANLLTMEATYFLSTWIFIAIVPSRFWDYAVTVTCLHVIFSCLAMLSFPVKWSWWVCLIGGLLTMVILGEMVDYLCRTNKELTCEQHADYLKRGPKST